MATRVKSAGRSTPEYKTFRKNMVKIRDALTENDTAKKTLEIKFKEVVWLEKSAEKSKPLDLVIKAMSIISNDPSQYEVFRKMLQAVGLDNEVLPSVEEADNELPQDPADIPQSEQGKDEPASAGSVGSETRSKDQVHSRRGSRANEHTLGEKVGSSASHPLRRDSGVGITASESQTMSDDSEFPAGTA
ncbi:hypothetical protein GBAR_LOCUS11355 [Geodia barretti]|uniref:Uncharacterized protein n=1 Tax=Geodia barretti TaxID=519541 RepID=A0AA35WFQ0_GEOBA|nr:hypothetical protein GBAR_LOCUS11355 [Geodia barretti]